MNMDSNNKKAIMRLGKSQYCLGMFSKAGKSFKKAKQLGIKEAKSWILKTKNKKDILADYENNYLINL